MAEPSKKPDPPKKEPRESAARAEPGTAGTKPQKRPAKAAPPNEPKGEAPSKDARPTKPTAPKAKAAAKKAAPKKTPTKARTKETEVKIVEKPTPKHQAAAKPTLAPELRASLSLRQSIERRRPRFRRQQWYEYKRLEDSGWRRPTGVDSAMRRHFGYEQPVVRIGFGGPRDARGLHPSGFREVYVEHVDHLKGIDPKTQAARVSGRLGARKLKRVYAEAEKLGIRILNRRQLE